MTYFIQYIINTKSLLRELFILFIALMIANNSFEQSVYVLTDTTVMQIGEQRTLDIELQTPQDIDPALLGLNKIIDSITYYGFDSTVVTGTENFEILHENGWEKGEGVNDQFLYNKTYLYTVWKDGLYVIPGPSPTILRVGTTIDTSYQGLAPLKDIITTDFDFGSILKKIAAFALLKLLLALLLIYLGIRLISNEKRERVDTFTVPLKLYVQHEANRFSKNSAQRNIKKFYSTFSRLVRLVLEKQLKIPVKGYTTSMIAAALNENLSTQNDNIIQFLNHADYVKYAQGRVGLSQLSNDYNAISSAVKDIASGDYDYKISGEKLKSIDPGLYEHKRIEQFNFAEWVPRLLAGITDLAIISTIFMLIILPFGYFEYFTYLLTTHFWMCIFVTACTYLILMSFYKTLGHTKTGQTLGKHFYNIEVVNIHHNFPSIITSFLRSLLSTPIVFLLGLGYITVFTLPRKQAFHDLALKTFVVTI